MDTIKRKRKIDALANEIILNGIRLFEERFPDGSDEDFMLLYACLHKQTGLELFKWEQEIFSCPKV